MIARVPIDACLGCRTGKIAYDSRREASTALKRHGGTKGLRPYHCECGFWHLGRPATKGRR